MISQNKTTPYKTHTTMEKNIFNPTEQERARLPVHIFNILVPMNLGPMLVNRNDRYVGQSLITYGELCEGEAALFRQLLKPGDVAIEAGANIGAHTVLLSNLVGESGQIIAYEPQRIVFQTLCANLALNQCLNVDARQQGLGEQAGEMTLPIADPRVINNFGGLSLLASGSGEKVAIATIDSLKLSRCHLIKIDVEGMEIDVLAGAQNTIQRCRPILYLENDRAEKSAALIARVLAMGYRAWWHLVPLFNPNNHANNPDNIFADTVSVNMLCQPAEFAFSVDDLREITDPAERWDVPLHIAPAAKCTMDASLPSDEESIYHERIQANPEDHAAWHALGLLAFVADDLQQAAQQVTTAIAIAPAVAQYHCDIGEIYRRMAQSEKSVLAGRRAIELAPHDPDAHYRLGLAYDDNNDIHQALACYRQTTELDSTHYLAWYYQGASLAQQGGTQAAIAAYTQAVTTNPGFAEAQHALGILLGKQGKHSEARSRFEMALRARPDFIATHFSLSSLKTYTVKDPHLAMLASIYDRRSELSDQARSQTCFAYGKALEDVGNHELSFAAYAEGNLAQHTLLPVNESQADDLVENIKALFNKKFFAKWRHRQNSHSTHTAFRPVFIVGMPHSGSSVLEKILTSHTSACRTEVRVDFSELLATVADAPPGKPLGKRIESLTDDNVQRIGEEYLHRIVHHAPNGIISVDRTLANYFYLGLIHLVLPQAKIIHILRDPMDTCFSCYSQLFADDSLAFSYDLESSGRHYVRYMVLMRHWHAVLPEGTILDLHYEDLITNMAGQARRALEFTGLTWNDRCLESNDNVIPRARWKHYAQYLEPLFNTVKHYRSEDDAAKIITSALPASILRSADEQHKQHRFAEALAYYDQAIALRPDNSIALNNKGLLLKDMGRMEEARDCFARAVTLTPEMAIARYNLGTTQLQLGNWLDGWENYEARWTGNNEAHQGLIEKPSELLPHWNGEKNTETQGLLVLTEQGAGDNLQFARYLTLATQRFAKVGFVCPWPLLRLIESSFGDKIFLLSSIPKDTADWHWQCSLMSLPRAFRTQEETIPAATPYFAVPPLAQAHWRTRLENAAPGRLRVGIAWAGNKSYAHDARRSLSFEQLLPLLRNQQVTWISLQVRMAPDRPPVIPVGINWLDWTTELADFADTAALVANLDLVISIDSAMAHLAGAMARPTWLLNRFEGEWRWLKDRDDSPWYPQMRIFTQPRFGDWNSVIETAAAVMRMESKIPLVTPRPIKITV